MEDVLYNDNHLYLVFEWLDRDLRRYLDEVDHVNPLLVRSYLFQTLQGIRACHAHRILHRDLKPQNLLIDSNGRLKLADILFIFPRFSIYLIFLTFGLGLNISDYHEDMTFLSEIECIRRKL